MHYALDCARGCAKPGKHWGPAAGSLPVPRPQRRRMDASTATRASLSLMPAAGAVCEAGACFCCCGRKNWWAPPPTEGEVGEESGDSAPPRALVAAAEGSANAPAEPPMPPPGLLGARVKLTRPPTNAPPLPPPGDDATPKTLPGDSEPCTLPPVTLLPPLTMPVAPKTGDSGITGSAAPAASDCRTAGDASALAAAAAGTEPLAPAAGCWRVWEWKIVGPPPECSAECRLATTLSSLACRPEVGVATGARLSLSVGSGASAKLVAADAVGGASVNGVGLVARVTEMEGREGRSVRCAMAGAAAASRRGDSGAAGMGGSGAGAARCCCCW